MLKSMTVESPRVLVNPTASSENKDIIQTTQERLIGDLISCGDNLFQTIREKEEWSGKDFEVDGMMVSSAFCRFNNAWWWTKFNSKRAQKPPWSIAWQVDAERKGRGGLRKREQVPLWNKNLIVSIENRGDLRSLELKSRAGTWEIRTRGEMLLEEPINFKEAVLSSIVEETFCVPLFEERPYLWPLSISRGSDNGRVLPKLTVTYGRRNEYKEPLDERVVKPWDSRVELEVATSFRHKDLKDQPPEVVYQDIFYRFGEASKVLEAIWKTFPEGVDFVEFLEEKVGFIISTTNQALAALKT